MAGFSHLRRPKVALVLALAFAGSTAAAADCAAVAKLAGPDEAGIPDQTRAHFVPFIGQPDACQRVQTLGAGAGLSCHRAFDYRSQEASAIFARARAQLAACPSLAQPVPRDPGVNHPDSYVLQQYRIGERVFSVSLKDKAALGQTMVFMRLDTGDAPE